MIEKNVLQALACHNMLKGVKKITVALSGGADSVCLLHILLSLKDRLGIEVCAAHLNHCIRGAEAKRDEAFVNGLAKKWEVPIICERVDVPAAAEKQKISLELAARQIRYDFLERVRGDGVIATAHNADDNLETMLFNLARGTALKGLCGIPPVRDKVIRPLLYCTRQRIEQYCLDNGIEYVTDSTNLSDDYTRNKIRHNIVPELKKLNPSLEEAVARTAKLLSADNDCLENITKKELEKRLFDDNKLSLDGFANLNQSIATRLLKLYCDCLGLKDISYRHIDLLYGVCINGGECCLPEKILVSRNKVLSVKEENLKKVRFKVEIASSDSKELEKDKKINNLLLKNYLDCDKIVGKSALRTRMSGDCVKLKNKNGTKSLKKLYTEYKIPVEKRDNWPVLCDDMGVVWIYKIGVAERCATDENSVNIIKIDVTEGFGDNNDNV
ncbi:MAG: tRNA lysidine(34) synthetase TilS [Clostridia bacterium]|nr:tRNA lysidine(34) synthetase TilS [Clostridia bacterium]